MEENNKFKTVLVYVIVFAVTLTVLVGALLITAGIPREKIKENVVESADYLMEKSLFHSITGNIDSTRVDRYADAILLGIAWQFGNGRTMETVMWSSYYDRSEEPESADLKHASEEDLPANKQYMRYWHGSITLLKPLLLIFNIKQIYIVNAVVLALLTGILLLMLFIHRIYIPAVGLLLGLILTFSYVVPFSLEYTWTFLLMLIFSIVITRREINYKSKWTGLYFLIFGMLTSFMDFLTTELITLFVPLLLLLWFRKNRRCDGVERHMDAWKKALCYSLVWGAGYAFTWISKWVIAGLYLYINPLKYVSEHIEERLGGNVGLSTWTYITRALSRNIKSLMPWQTGETGAVISIAVLLVLSYIMFVYKRNKVDRKYILIYLIIAVIPYIRYVVLHNHSFLHYFFTYRAQIITILALTLIFGELTDRSRMGHGNKKKK
ncbi:MAG: hypothetical protein K6C35_03195 [Eubacterium sp.]|nr:hypothetical protein [Eubacterium sp.]